jgi:hypothetical protein
VLAYCPYCKKKVNVIPRLKEEEALQLLSEKQRIEVMHVGSDGDHAFMTERVREVPLKAPTISAKPRKKSRPAS